MNIIYFLIRLFIKFISQLLYQEYEVIDLQNLPKQGPVIVFPNHNNCYVDGVTLVKILPRHVSLLSAVVAYKSSIVISYLLKLSGGIPLERSWDLAYAGAGKILSIKNGNVIGKETTFTKCNVGDIIELSNGKQFRILQIEDDTHCQIKSHDYKFEKQDSYRIIPKLSYEDTYQQVWKGLNDGRCVAIFPEGDTHDKLELLPLKVGICIAALGAMEKYGKPVTLVPCGMSFENQHILRSKTTVQFGAPYEIPMSLVDLYRTNKTVAINTLFDSVNRMLKDVTYDFRHYEQFESLKTMHSIYEASTLETLTPKERMNNLRQITKKYSDSIKNGETSLKSKLKKAVDLAKKTKLDVKSLEVYSKQEIFTSSLLSFLFLIISALLIAPGFLMYFIAILIARHLTEKQRLSSLRYTKNRLHANDVVSSYMMIHCLWLIPIFTIINFTLLPIILQYVTTLSASEISFICITWLLFQPIHALLLVKLWDLASSSIGKLRKYAFYIFKKDVVYDMIELRKEILSYISFNMLKNNKTSQEELVEHRHRD